MLAGEHLTVDASFCFQVFRSSSPGCPPPQKGVCLLCFRYNTNTSADKQLERVLRPLLASFTFSVHPGTAGNVEHGDQYQLKLLYEHNLQRTACCMTHGTFGGVSGGHLNTCGFDDSAISKATISWLQPLLPGLGEALQKSVVTMSPHK